MSEPRTRHMANKVDQRGNVSPLCADRPRKLNLDRETWTLTAAAVTCKKCLARLLTPPADRVAGD